MHLIDCPGPRRFVERLIDAVLASPVTITVRAQLAPADEAITRASKLLRENGYKMFTCHDSSESPVDVLTIAAQLPPARKLPALIQNSAILGSVFWVHVNSSSRRSLWLPTLEAYQRAAHGTRDAPRIVLVLEGDAYAESISSSMASAPLHFDDMVDTSDTLLLAYYESGLQHGGGVIAQVRAQAAAAIANSDTALLARLLDRKNDEIFQPKKVLEDYAAQCGWTPAEIPSRRSGTLRKGPQGKIIHSALLAAFKDPHKEIESRVWSGQAAVLLPRIEAERLHIVQANSQHLSKGLPLKTEFGTVSDVADLEIGHVAHLLTKGNQNSPDARRARELRVLRNLLAHMTPLSEIQVRQLL